MMKRFGAKARKKRRAEPAGAERGPGALTGRASTASSPRSALRAICFGLVNFGLLLWLPADLLAKGYRVGVSSKLLAKSALIAIPTVFVVA